MDESPLLSCNETELMAFARANGPALRRGLPIEALVEIVGGYRPPRQDELAGTNATRKALQVFIDRNWERAKSQLPGCNGKCTTYPCTEGRHLMCMAANRHQVMS